MHFYFIIISFFGGGGKGVYDLCVGNESLVCHDVEYLIVLLVFDFMIVIWLEVIGAGEILSLSLCVCLSCVRCVMKINDTLQQCARQLVTEILYTLCGANSLQ